MENGEKISGERISKIFDQLQKERTVLKLSILGEDYERLTIVTGIENEKGIPYFLIDYPSEFREIIQNAEGRRILFEYSDRHKINYTFRTNVGKSLEDEIWVRFPETIERIQRRKEFRIAPPLGTKILFNVDDRRFETNVINISKGGALINQKARFHENKIFYVDAIIRNLTLICKEKHDRVRIGIKKAVIKRMEKRRETGKYHYALHFIDMEKGEEDELRTYIYKCQRQAIKKRMY